MDKLSSTTAELKLIPKNNYINSYTVGKMVVDEVVNVYGLFWELIRRSQQHLQGEKPVKFQSLKDRGLDWCSNENFLKATGEMQKLVSQSVGDMFKAIAMGYVTFRQYDEAKDKGTVLEDILQDEARQSICSMAIGYAFADMFLKENRLADFLNAIEYASIGFGVSYLLDYDGDWVPEVVHPLNIGCKPRSKPDNIPSWVVFQTIDGQTLWEKWEETYNASRSIQQDADGNKQTIVDGWVLEGLQEVLWRAFRGKIENKSAPDNWGDVFAAYNVDGRASVIENTDSITLAKIYYKELDGSLTICYIPYDNNRDPKKVAYEAKGGQNSVDCRLFIKNIKRYKQNEKLNLIRDSGYTETHFIEDYRGIAKYLITESIRYNRVRNSLADKVQLLGTPFFEADNTQTTENFKMGVGTAFAIMPKGYTLLTAQPSFDIQGPMAYLAFEQGQYNQNTEHFDADISGRLSSRPNKDEVRSQQAEVNKLNMAKTPVKFSDYSMVFFNILKKLGKINFNSGTVARAGQDRFFNTLKKQLKGYATTKDDLKKILAAVDSFVLTPVITDLAVLIQAEREAQTPYARNRFRRMRMIAQGLPMEEVNIAVPLIIDKLTNFENERWAQVENDSFINGSKQIVLGTDDHIIHLDIHFARVDELLMAFQEQRLTADYCFKYLSNSLKHCIEHIQLLGSDPVHYKKVQETYGPKLQQLMKVRKQLEAQAQADMEAAAREREQFQLDPETAADINRKNIESQEKMRRQNELQQNRTMQSIQKIQSDQQVQLVQIEADQEVEFAKIQSDLNEWRNSLNA